MNFSEQCVAARVAVLCSAVTKEPCKRDYILQKRLITSRSLLIVARVAVLCSAVTSPVSVLQHAAEHCNTLQHAHSQKIQRCKSRYISCELQVGWLRLVGSFKLQVSFAKEPCKRDYILDFQIILWSSGRGLYSCPYYFSRQQFSVTSLREKKSITIASFFRG